MIDATVHVTYPTEEERKTLQFHLTMKEDSSVCASEMFGVYCCHKIVVELLK